MLKLNMTNKIIKGIVLTCSILIGIGMLVELDQSDDMDLFATLFAIVVLTVANVKLLEQKEKKE